MEIKKEAIILADIRKVFNIVNRANLYKNFVPFCTNSSIITEDKDCMEAKLDFDIKGIKTSFTTRNSICENRFIEMKLVDGPFKFLDGKWEFKEANGRTIVTLYINYEPKNKIVEYAVGKSLEKISGILVKSFVEESMK